MSRKLSGEFSTQTGSQAMVSPSASVPGSAEFMYLDIRTVHCLQTHAASYFQEETVSRMSRIAQLILQVLRDTLRWASL